MAALPSGFLCLNKGDHGLLESILLQAFCDGLAVALIKSDLTVTSTNISVETTILCHLTGWLHVFIALCCCHQLEAAPTSNAILIAETVVKVAIAAQLVDRSLDLPIPFVSIGCLTLLIIFCHGLFG